MMDRDQLREQAKDAVKILEATGEALPWIAAEALRLVADPDTLTIDWCEFHQNKMAAGACYTALYYGASIKECQRSRRLLLAPALDALLEGQPR